MKLISPVQVDRATVHGRQRRSQISPGSVVYEPHPAAGQSSPRTACLATARGHQVNWASEAHSLAAWSPPGRLYYAFSPSESSNTCHSHSHNHNHAHGHSHDHGRPHLASNLPSGLGLLSCTGEGVSMAPGGVTVTGHGHGSQPPRRVRPHILTLPPFPPQATSGRAASVGRWWRDWHGSGAPRGPRTSYSHPHFNSHDYSHS